MKIKLGLYAVVGIILVMSCGKSLDAVKPTIEYVNPKEGEIVTMGTDSLHLKLILRDDQNVDYIKMDLTSPIGSIYSKTYMASGQMIVFQDSFMPKGVFTTTPMTLNVVVRDKQNETTSLVNFNVTP